MSWYYEQAPVPCEQSRDAALARQAQLTKPPGALGRLEEVAVDIAAMQRAAAPSLDRVAIRIFAGDHGVASEGVSAFPQAVTVQMIDNFARGGAAISVLARQAGADFSVINMGTATPAPDLPGVQQVQLAPGTDNFCLGAAMSAATLEKALTTGADTVAEECDVFIGGEMGIANTTSAASIACALLAVEPGGMVGRGTGLDDAGLSHKCEVVARALALHKDAGQQPLEILRRLGGLEIAALVGAYIRAAQCGVLVLVDGYICTVAALVACRLNDSVRPWLLFSHRSAEPGHTILLDALDAQPLVAFDMRLGEGSGAALVLPLLRSACQLHNEMATFAEAGVSDGGEA